MRLRISMNGIANQHRKEENKIDDWKEVFQAGGGLRGDAVGETKYSHR